MGRLAKAVDVRQNSVDLGGLESKHRHIGVS